MQTEREKMLAGELYRPTDPELVALRLAARRLVWEFNRSSPDEGPRRTEILRALFGSTGQNIEIEPSFHCDYGCNIHVGDGFFANFGCVILDVCRVDIGHGTMFAPGVQVLTATHPKDAATRVSGVEYALPIRIGNRVWVGAGALILPGVTIGDDVIIGAGAVVTRDVPTGATVVGNPARVRG